MPLSWRMFQRLGPDALNLSGTRAGAERIAHRIGDLGIFDSSDTDSTDLTTGGQRIPGGAKSSSHTKLSQKLSRSAGGGNYFEGLSEVEA
ncbi:hypothetical protein JCM10295v2_000218 [Rhodotorula toruloides]